jgi:hypothetical protein
LAQGALAVPIPDPPYETGTKAGSGWGGTWNSDISCTVIGSPTDVNSIGFTDVTQTATVSCLLTNDDTSTLGPSNCILNITYHKDVVEGPDLSVCSDNENGTSTLTAAAFCGDPDLVVTGTLDCNPLGLSIPPAICGGNNPCIANLDGISDVLPGTYAGQCGDVFPDNNNSLAAGQVLNVSVTTTGSGCTGQIVELSDIETRFCNSGSFDPGVESSCAIGEDTARITGLTNSFLQVTVAIDQDSINVKCDPKKDNGKIGFTIFGDTSVDVTQIDTGTLFLQELPVPTCDAPRFVLVNGVNDGFLDLHCKHVPSCPVLAPGLVRLPDGTASLVVDGSLLSGTPIRGEDTVKTTPKAK